MKDAEERAREVVAELVSGYGSEVFVQDGYGFYDDAIKAVAKALRAERRAALEEAARYLENYDTSDWYSNFQDVGIDFAWNIRALANAEDGG